MPLDSAALMTSPIVKLKQKDNKDILAKPAKGAKNA